MRRNRRNPSLVVKAQAPSAMPQSMQTSTNTLASETTEGKASDDRKDLLPGRAHGRVRYRQPHRREHVSRQRRHQLVARPLRRHARGRHAAPLHALVPRAGAGRARRAGGPPHSPQARRALRRRDDSEDVPQLSMVTVDGELALLRVGDGLVDCNRLAWASRIACSARLWAKS